MKIKKITELTETKWRTVFYKDAYGNRIKDREEITIQRQVKTISQGPRIGHFTIDFVLLQLIFYSTNLLLAAFYYPDEDHVIIQSFSLILVGNMLNLIIYPLYYIFFEYYWQKTPGKFITKTTIIDEYGNKPDLKAIILRTFIRLVPFEPFSCFDDKHSYGWHDKWSKTWVVNEEELAELRKLQAEQL